MTVEELIREGFCKYAKENEKGHTDILRSFELYISPLIGNVPKTDATIHLWLTVLEPLARKTPSTQIAR
jgi:hypothetical protein